MANCEVDTIKTVLSIGSPYDVTTRYIPIPEISSGVLFDFYTFPASCPTMAPADFQLQKINPIPGRYVYERHLGQQCLQSIVITPFKYEIVVDSGKSYIMSVTGGGERTLQVQIYRSVPSNVLIPGLQKKQPKGVEKAFLVNGQRVRVKKVDYGVLMLKPEKSMLGKEPR